MSVKFYNAWFCPFAQRAWIALVHKGVKFEYIEQDPYNKSPEWLAVNPRGLVPAILHNDKAIYESAVCIGQRTDFFVCVFLCKFCIKKSFSCKMCFEWILENSILE